MKIFRNILVVISIAFFVWFGISYFEILGKNLNGNVVLSCWNLFTFF